jgi:hypothetical protein
MLGPFSSSALRPDSSGRFKENLLGLRWGKLKVHKAVCLDWIHLEANLRLQAPAAGGSDNAKFSKTS